MKKLLGILLGSVLLCAAAHAQQGNLLNGKLEKAEQVCAAVEAGNLLPLNINEYYSFNGEAEKQVAVQCVQAKLRQADNYVNNYNAAVIFATASAEEGVDYGVRVTKEEADQAVNYATKAIAKGNGKDTTVYMYLLRGQTLFEHVVDYSIGNGETDLKNRAGAVQALADFEKVAEMKSSLAPYGNMAVLAEVLGDEAKMEQYQLKGQMGQ